jgi:uncharacterized membrane protein YbhN (UPF0104 family)
MPARPGRWRQKSVALASAAPPADKRRVSASPAARRARTVLRYALSLAALAWIGWSVDWSAFGSLRGLDLPLALFATALSGVAYPLQAWRWQRLLAAQGIVPGTAWVHGVFWLGNFYNSFLPGGIAGDGVRLHYTWKQDAGRRAGAAASIVADRLLGFAALVGLAAAALALQLILRGDHAGLRSLLIASAATLAALTAGAFVLVRPGSWVPFAARWLGVGRANSLGAAFAAVGAKRGTLYAVLGVSVTVWLADFAALWLLARAVGLETGVLEIAVAGAAAYVAATLPISIGGHGVREGALVIVLGWLGVGSGQPGHVLQLAVAFWAVTTGWSLLGGLAAFLPATAGRKESAAPSPPA